MQLTIDNLDGKGPLDYSTKVSSRKGLVIDRKLNVPTVCTFRLTGCGGNLPAPVRDGRVLVSDDSGLLLFSGYVALEPAMEFAGSAMTGAVYEVCVSAASDELLLDRQPVPQTSGTSGQTVAATLRSLTARVGQVALSIDPQLEQVTVSEFTAHSGLPWSANAGPLATAAGAAYRAIGGTVSVASFGSVVHTLQDTDGSLQVSGMSAATVASLANDVTVCGQIEPTAYVEELFRGDGVTSVFQLTRTPLLKAASNTKPLADLFQEPTVNPLLWSVSDPSSAFSVTSKGLTFKGGNGIDGQTAVSSLDQIELGGLLVAESAGVQIQAGGAGLLNGLFLGGTSVGQCLAGFQVVPNAGAATITPIVLGALAGASLPLQAGRSYTLRTRVHCKEMQRVSQTYRYLQGGGMASTGGDTIDCPASITLELQDVSGGGNATVTVLYDGAADYSPSVCSFVPVSSISLSGSIQSAAVRQTGSAWVASQAAGGVPTTRRMGTATEGADCILEATGRLRFYATSIPKAGELITVSYRIGGRSVARLADQQSIDERSHGSISGRSSWTGSVSSPSPRSSVDCENAAAALLSIAGDRNAAWRGSYSGVNLQVSGDVWPGDLLQVNSESAGMQATLAVREVRLEVEDSSPSLIKYEIAFANDWAENLAIRLAATIPGDAWIPQQPAEAGNVLPNLQSLQVASVDSSKIQVQAGATPPANGGFEVRRRDWAFRAGTDPDLVLRSPVGNFNIPRESGTEQYFVRMYDGSTPPLYSRFSSAIFNNVPV